MRALSACRFSDTAQQSGPLSPLHASPPASHTSFFQMVILPWSRSSSIPMRSPKPSRAAYLSSCGVQGIDSRWPCCRSSGQSPVT